MNLLKDVPQAMLDRLPDFLLNPNPEIFLSENFVVFDLETNTKGDAGSPLPCWEKNSIVCASWCKGIEGEAYNIYGNELEIGELVDELEDTDFIVAHNAKFDIGWMKRAGLDIYKVVVYDTMIAEYCLNGNIKAPLSLDALAKKYVGAGKAPYIDLCMKGGVDPEDMPKSMLIARCDSDILLTRAVFREQLKEIVKRGMLGHVLTRCLLSPALADIESNGMHLDGEAVTALYNERAMGLAKSTAELDAFTGGVNPRSPKQVKQFVYDELKFKPKMRGKGRGATPIYSTKTEDLLQLKATTKRQREFVRLKKEFSGFNADVGKNLLFFNSVVQEKTDNLFYAQFNQCVTVTHRLSSTGIPRTFPDVLDDKGRVITKSVQFQNFKREFKPIMSPRKEGWSMGEADGSQLEFRVTAFLCQCPVATQDIVNNTDVHIQTARVITENGQPTERQEAKAHTFKPLYGGSSGTKAEQAYYKWFKEYYSGIGKTQQRWMDEAVATKKVVLPHGFTFHFPYAKVTHSGYVEQSTNICNYPGQHFATAEIIPIAVVYQWHLMREMESFLVNTIHDSVIAELHPDEHQEFRDISKASFTYLVYHYLDEVYDVQFNVPLGVGCKIGTNWGTGSELVCVPQPPFDMDGINYDQLITDWTEG